MNQIVELALNARTVADVDALETELRAHGATDIRFLGDRETNWSTLSNAADPKPLLFERVTNQFDALIDAQVLRQSIPASELSSPARAAQSLFGIPREGVGGLTRAERERIGKTARIVLLDSDDSRRRPTIAFRDFGVGVAREDAPRTILSLEASNKLSKPYQHGIFGKGGSLASMFSSATVVVARRQPDLLGIGQEDEVSVAVVRRDDRDDYGLPFFRYLVGASDGLPWACPASTAAEFDPGVYVAHVNFEADRMGEHTWQQDDSIYAYAETVLFRPTLPFSLADDRTSPQVNKRPEGRGLSILSGLGRRLDGLEAQPDMASDDAAAAPLIRRTGLSSIPISDVGTARIRWWLFRDNNRRRSYVARGYVVVFTHDGQVHHSWDQQRFQTMVPNRRRVAERILVEVDLEEVPRKQRIQIFSSMRDSLRKTQEARRLEEAIATWLAQDPDLEEAESRFTKDALQKSAQQISRRFLDRLNRAIAAKVPTVQILESEKSRGTKPRPPKKPEELHSEPTAFTGPEQLTIIPGETHIFYMSINAVDGFVPDRGQIELDPGPSAFRLSVGDLRRGRIQLAITPDLATSLGQQQTGVTLTWLRSSGGVGTLHWPIEVRLVAERAKQAPKQPPPNDKAKQVEGARRSVIALVWNHLEQNRASGWTEETAGDLQRITGKVLGETYPDTYEHLKDVESEIPTIVLNEEFAPWSGYKRGSAIKGDVALNLRRERYGIALGVAIANLWVQEETIAKRYTRWQANGSGGEGPEIALTETQKRRAVGQAARGILALLPDFDYLTAELEEKTFV